MPKAPPTAREIFLKMQKTLDTEFDLRGAYDGFPISDAVAKQRAADAKQERIRRTRDNETRVEAAHRTKLVYDAAIAKQTHMVTGKLAQQQAAEAASQLAGEQAEAAMLLSAAFKPASKPKRGEGEYVTSSQ